MAPAQKPGGPGRALPPLGAANGGGGGGRDAVGPLGKDRGLPDPKLRGKPGARDAPLFKPLPASVRADAERSDADGLIPERSMLGMRVPPAADSGAMRQHDLSQMKATLQRHVKDLRREFRADRGSLSSVSDAETSIVDQRGGERLSDFRSTRRNMITANLQSLKANFGKGLPEADAYWERLAVLESAKECLAVYGPILHERVASKSRAGLKSSGGREGGKGKGHGGKDTRAPEEVVMELMREMELLVGHNERHWAETHKAAAPERNNILSKLSPLENRPLLPGGVLGPQTPSTPDMRGGFVPGYGGDLDGGVGGMRGLLAPRRGLGPPPSQTKPESHPPSALLVDPLASLPEGARRKQHFSTDAAFGRRPLPPPLPRAGSSKRQKLEDDSMSQDSAGSGGVRGPGVLPGDGTMGAMDDEFHSLGVAKESFPPDFFDLKYFIELQERMSGRLRQLLQISESLAGKPEEAWSPEEKEVGASVQREAEILAQNTEQVARSLEQYPQSMWDLYRAFKAHMLLMKSLGETEARHDSLCAGHHGAANSESFISLEDELLQELDALEGKLSESYTALQQCLAGCTEGGGAAAEGEGGEREEGMEEGMVEGEEENLEWAARGGGGGGGADVMTLDDDDRSGNND